MYYCCSINLKRQSEHSGLRPDTSSLVTISFDLINRLSLKKAKKNGRKKIKNVKKQPSLAKKC